MFFTQSVTAFAPLPATIGGVLIGLSALTLMLSLGRIAGASGIFGGLLTLNFDAAWRWRLVFITGLLVGAAFSGLFFFDPTQIRFPGGPAFAVLGGLIVGVGVTLGSGCTSGHGICGMARLSKRSIAATCIFMAVTIVTVFVTRHMMGA